MRGQRLDFEVHELAWPRPLGAGDGGGRLERCHAIQAVARQDECDRRARHVASHGNRPRRQPLAPGGNDCRHYGGRWPPRLAKGLRRPIPEGGLAALTIPGQPFKRGADGDSRRGRSRGD